MQEFILTLMITGSPSFAGGPVTVEGFLTLEKCEAAGEQMQSIYDAWSPVRDVKHICIPVEK